MAKQYSNFMTGRFFKARKFDYEYLQHWNHFSRTRHDAKKFIDLMAWRPDYGSVVVQACNKHDHSAHIKKLCTHGAAIRYVEGRGNFYLFTWRKVGAKGRRQLWQPKIERAAVRNGQLRFYETKGTVFDLPVESAPQQPLGSGSQVEAEQSKPLAPAMPVNPLQIQAPEVRKRRAALMRKRQAKMHLPS